MNTSDLFRRRFLKSSLAVAAETVLCRGVGGANTAPPTHPAFSAGDVLRTEWKEDWQALPLGSGRFGGCFDAWSLQNVGRFADPSEDSAPTVLLHKEHWVRNEYGRDNFDDVARVAWLTAPPKPAAYRQHLDLFNGQLHTNCQGPGWMYSAQASFHTGWPDVLAIRILKRGPLPGLTLVLPEGNAGEIRASESTCALGVFNRNCRTSVLLRVLALKSKPVRLRVATRGVALQFDGEVLLLIGAASSGRLMELERALATVHSAQEFFSGAADAWRKRIGASWIRLSHPGLQSLWARSLYYTLIGHGEKREVPAAACGLTGVKWRTHFPQDHSYVAPALLRLGHARTVGAWVEFYRRHLEWQKEITARTFRKASNRAPAEGVMWSWLFPIGDGAEFIRNGAPNHFYYEIHNAAYPAKMAWDTARFLREDDWLAETAWPVIEASARFYSSVLERGGDGLWGIHVLPSMGQDEMGGPDATDYLCALYAARYTLTIAVAAAERLGRKGPDLERWLGILGEGLAFERLRHPGTGLLLTNRNVLDGSNLGRQKHPVQLQPLVFTPLPGKPDADGVKAFLKRDQLCLRGTERPRWSTGWTLATYWAAATRLGLSAELENMLSDATLQNSCDREGLSFRETIGSPGNMYYLANHGLFMQALQDGFADDTFGSAQFGKLATLWPSARCQGLCLADGRRVSGAIADLSRKETK